MKHLPALAAGSIFIAALIPAAAPTQPAHATVTIVHDAFTPPIIHVRAGEKVTFLNGDDETHTFTSDAALFDSGHVDEKQKYVFTFTKSGSYPYHCAIHTFMKGTVIVDPADAKT
jgi:plastocyanin